MQSNGEIETAKKFKDFYDLFKSTIDEEIDASDKKIKSFPNN